jgi:hypothetical protein
MQRVVVLTKLMEWTGLPRDLASVRSSKSWGSLAVYIPALTPRPTLISIATSRKSSAILLTTRSTQLYSREENHFSPDSQLPFISLSGGNQQFGIAHVQARFC